LPTGLQFQRGSFGPFSRDVKQLQTQLVNNGLVFEERLGPMFAVRVGDTFDDARRAYSSEIECWEPTLARIADLFVRMNTKQAEIAATVLFAAHEVADEKGGMPAEIDVLRDILQWKQRRKGFPEADKIAVAIRNLAALGWIKVKPSADLPLPVEAMADVF
jgi:hypothetical protein